jgi:hypothetical protein
MVFLPQSGFVQKAISLTNRSSPVVTMSHAVDVVDYYAVLDYAPGHENLQVGVTNLSLCTS